MYEWETHSDNTQVFGPGQVVGLNPSWSGYTYLVREYGKLFPRFVKNMSGGVVSLEGTMLSFASQTLTKKLHD